MERRFQRTPSLEALENGNVRIPGNHIDITEMRVNRGYSFHEYRPVVGIKEGDITVFSLAEAQSQSK